MEQTDFLHTTKKILICPLNWGLGHATRCIPIIKQLLKHKKEVIIASDGYALALLKTEFPTVSFIQLPSYNIRYGKGKSQVSAMLTSLPFIINGIYKEHKQLKKIISKYNIDTVLSDNRFGMWNKQIRSLYMTHQLMIKMPQGLKWLGLPVWRLHRSIINRYDACLIPDESDNGGFAGDLTHKYPLPRKAQFIGILSRFSGSTDIKQPDVCFKVVCVLSGVEPQRTMMQNILTEALAGKPFHSLIVQGLPGNNQYTTHSGNIKIVSSLSANELERHLYHAPFIICRSGYSSIMDLITLQKSALLVPTPGQTEQEYLADYLTQKGLFTSVNQDNLKQEIEKKFS